MKWEKEELSRWHSSDSHWISFRGDDKETPFYRITREIVWHDIDDGTEVWRCHIVFAEYPNFDARTEIGDKPTLEEAKALCQKHLEELIQALEQARDAKGE